MSEAHLQKCHPWVDKESSPAGWGLKSADEGILYCHGSWVPYRTGAPGAQWDIVSTIEGEREPRRDITTGAVVGDCAGMLWGCHASKMAWPCVCHWISIQAGLCPLTPDTCHQSLFVGKQEMAPNVRQNTTRWFSTLPTPAHTRAAPRGAFCATGWKELLSKPRKGTCESRLSSADRPKPTYKWVFNTFLFDTPEICVGFFERTFYLENELNFPFERLKKNKKSQNRMTFFFKPEINSCYGLIFLIHFGATGRINISFRLAWNNIVHISQWFKNPPPVCRDLL